MAAACAFGVQSCCSGSDWPAYRAALSGWLSLPRRVRSGTDEPMRTHSILIITLGLAACHNQHDTQRSPSTRPSPRPLAAPEERAQLKVHVATLGDAAALAGTHIDYVSLALATCYRRNVECHEELGMDIASCQIVLAREWCKRRDCSTPFTTRRRADPCRAEIAARACDDLDRPLECPDVEAAGIVLIPSAWPEGPVVDPMPPMN